MDKAQVYSETESDNSRISGNEVCSAQTPYHILLASFRPVVARISLTVEETKFSIEIGDRLVH
jgi:hypothetical protein